MAELDAPISDLGAAWKSLREIWNDTKPLWDDSVSHNFEKRYWIAIEYHTQAALKEMQQLAQAIAVAHHNVR